MNLDISLVLFALMVCHGSALVCYQCSNVTGLPQQDCNNPINQTCDVGYDTCLIALYNLTNNFGSKPLIQVLRNCSAGCNKNDMCNKRNKTTNGEVLGCKFHCCKNNRCNFNWPTPIQTTLVPTTTTTSLSDGSTMAPSTTDHEVTKAFGTAVSMQVFSGSICSALFFGRIAAILA